MKAAKAKGAPARSDARSKPVLAAEAKRVVAELEALGSRRVLDDMANRYGIRVKKAFGVPVGKIKALGKRLGHDHELALALWATGWYEARILCAFVDEPERVTPAQMDRWCRDFDNWGIVDTICFSLFDRTPHAFAKVPRWGRSKREFEKRAGFVLLACLAGHDRNATDAAFLRCLPLIEKAANDERNFVKKGVSWALRRVGRRNRALNAASVALAKRLAGSENTTARWIGRGAVKELESPLVRRRLATRP